MKKTIWHIGLILALFFSVSLRADVTNMVSSEDDYPILQNRFRIDSTIKQAAFMIYREKRSSPVVLVDPDGNKFHPWDCPENMAWYTEDGMDIIIIEHPKAGPWQAIGNVSKKNKIRILSDVRLNVEKFPDHFYQGEIYKYTAKLTEEGKPVQIYDFIERVKLGVEFTAVIGQEETKQNKKKTITSGKVIVGEFEDNGAGYDEVAGDGTFTVEMVVDVEPGKYEANILAENGVFLRAVKQNVLVYPKPYALDFKVGKNLEPSVLRFIPYEIDLVPQSLAVHLDIRDPVGDITSIEAVNTSKDEDNSGKDLEVNFPKPQSYGTYSWEGWLYGTDTNDREFVIKLKKHKYEVVNAVDLAKAQAARLEEIKKREEDKRLRLIAEAKARKVRLMWVIGISVLVLILVIAGVIFFVIKRKKRLELEEKTQEDEEGESQEKSPET